MHHEPRSKQIEKQIAHFAELEEGMKEYLRTRGFPEGFTKGQMQETTPQHMEMELMLRMWIREEVILKGKQGYENYRLHKLLNERSQGVFDRDFQGLLEEMRLEGEIVPVMVRDWDPPFGPVVYWFDPRKVPRTERWDKRHGRPRA